MPNSGTDRDEAPRGIEAERQATRALGLAIHAALPEGWDSIEYTVAIAGGVSNAQVDLRREGVDEIGTVRPTHEMRSHARELRGAMYREGTGTWFSASWTVTRAGAMKGHYDYDSRPNEWFSAGSYAEDLARFPRDPEHIPAWLHELLDSDDEGTAG